MHFRTTLIIVMALNLAGCLAEQPKFLSEILGCNDLILCPTGFSCNSSGICIDPSTCGNGVVESWETCDDGAANTTSYSEIMTCNDTCTDYAPYCGDGKVTDDEVCDDKELNQDSYSTAVEPVCNLSCSGFAPRCGDGQLDSDDGEVCDLGGANSDAYERYPDANGTCRMDCSGPTRICGDGTLDPEEDCDDGLSNTEAYSEGIVCNTSCDGEAPRCGDGNTTHDEECDDGVYNTDDYVTVGTRCNTTCEDYAPRCGDGKLDSQFGEVCDLGESNSDLYQRHPLGATCTSSCSGPGSYCGDGVINTGFETCDDGPNNSNEATGVEHCNADCNGIITAFCGNGVVDSEYGETCDDGNNNNNDECPDGIGGTCRWATCGDGFTREGVEDCDSGALPSSCDSVSAFWAAGNVSCSQTCQADYSDCEASGIVHTNTVGLGNSHACAINASGRLKCWGQNVGASAVPDPTGTYTSVSAGQFHTCALDAAGDFSCWGGNSYNELNIPESIVTPSAFAAAKYRFTCATTPNGTPECWGDGILCHSDEPIPPPPSSIGASALTCGGSFACALKDDGGVDCWGSQPSPSWQAPKKLTSGEYHVCAILNDKSVQCIDSEPLGCISSFRDVEVPNNLGPVIDIASGLRHVCAINARGEIVCWGSDWDIEGPPPTNGPYVAIWAGWNVTCALRTTGELDCWNDVYGYQVESIPSSLGKIF